MSIVLSINLLKDTKSIISPFPEKTEENERKRQRVKSERKKDKERQRLLAHGSSLEVSLYH